MAKIQFNSKDAKNFRIQMANYYNARHSFNDFILKHNDSIKAVKTCLDTDNADITAIGLGEYNGMRTLDEIKQSRDLMTARLESLKCERDKAKELCESITNDVEKYVTDSLYNAYVRYITLYQQADYVTAIAEYFNNCGVNDATPENCTVFLQYVGRDKASARQSCKNGNLTKPCTRSKFASVFLGSLVDYFASTNVIAPYKYQYVLENATK